MRKTLYLKLILAYIIFGLFGFVVVATFVSNMYMDHLKKVQADSLYREATLIANTYASGLYNNEVSLEVVKSQLDALDTYLDATLWIINPSGRLILDSSAPLDVENEIMVENFDPTVTAGSYYTIGNFFHTFEEDMLSVFAPITSDFKVKGYVVIHSSISGIMEEANNLLTISYIMLIILFLLSLIILIFFTEIVYIPLRKITEATEQYASGNMHYDLAPQPLHSHFICRKCGRIFDMTMPEGLSSAATPGFTIDSVDLYFKGCCPDCLNSDH